MHRAARTLPTTTNTIRKGLLCLFGLKNWLVCILLSADCLPGSKILNRRVIRNPRRQRCKQRIAAYQKTAWIGQGVKDRLCCARWIPSFQQFGSLKYWFYWAHRLVAPLNGLLCFPVKAAFSFYISIYWVISPPLLPTSLLFLLKLTWRQNRSAYLWEDSTVGEQFGAPSESAQILLKRALNSQLAWFAISDPAVVFIFKLPPFHVLFLKSGGKNRHIYRFLKKRWMNQWIQDRERPLTFYVFSFCVFNYS